METKESIPGFAFRNILVLIIIILIVIEGCLLAQNNSYKQENRKLIIQNDSILSENIELKEALNTINKPGKKAAGSIINKTGQKESIQ